jgi:hypothetical protein
MDETRTARWDVLSTQKWLQLARLTQGLAVLLTVYWHYKQWRKAGAIEALMSALHGQVRQQVKKSPVDYFADD